jgi:hypothetical protein
VLDELQYFLEVLCPTTKLWRPILHGSEIDLKLIKKEGHVNEEADSQEINE